VFTLFCTVIHFLLAKEHCLDVLFRCIDFVEIETNKQINKQANKLNRVRRCFEVAYMILKTRYMVRTTKLWQVSIPDSTLSLYFGIDKRNVGRSNVLGGQLVNFAQVT